MTDSSDFILFVSEALTLGFIILAKTNKIPTHTPSFLPSKSEKSVCSRVSPFSLSFQFVFFAGGRVLPKHNAQGPAGAPAEVQVDQAGQGGRDVGPVVSEGDS